MAAQMILLLLGPPASGKTRLATKLEQTFAGRTVRLLDNMPDDARLLNAIRSIQRDTDVIIVTMAITGPDARKRAKAWRDTLGLDCHVCWMDAA